MRWPTPKQLHLFGSTLPAQKALDASHSYLQTIFHERLRQLTVHDLGMRDERLAAAESSLAQLAERVSHLEHVAPWERQAVLDSVPSQLQATATDLVAGLEPDECNEEFGQMAAPDSRNGRDAESEGLQSYVSRLFREALRTGALMAQHQHVRACAISEGDTALSSRSVPHTVNVVESARKVRPILENAIADAIEECERALGKAPSVSLLPGDARATLLHGSIEFAAREVVFQSLRAMESTQDRNKADFVEIEIGYSRGSLGVRVSDVAGGMTPPEIRSSLRFRQSTLGRMSRNNNDIRGINGINAVSHADKNARTLTSFQNYKSYLEVLSPPMGSGLALARTHARYHGGDIVLCSWLGKGVDTYLTLDATGMSGG